MISYRKTKSGTWVAYGPASEIKAGETIQVTVSNGDCDSRTVGSVGKIFKANGLDMVYGYLADAKPRVAAGAAAARTGGMCDECGERRATTAARDLSGIVGRVCGACKRNEGTLSFC